MEDILAGKINSVIAKDPSRLGRAYITTGYYIEVISQLMESDLYL